jgi:hypothetical protein
MSQLRIESVCRQGSGRANEDAVVLAPDSGLFAVIDGATALGESGLPGSLAAAAVAEVLQDVPRSTPLLGAVAAANRRIAETFARHSGERGAGAARRVAEVPAEERSSCGVAVIRLQEEARLEFVQAGDCMAFVQYRDGAVRALTWDRIGSLDDTAIAAAHAEARRLLGDAAPPDMDAARATAHLAALRMHVLPLLQRHRRLLNAPGGYGALDGTAEAMARLEWGSVDVGNVAAVLLLSDGLQLPGAACGGGDSWTASARLAFASGVAALCARIDALESSDPACFSYPRLKFADDKSGILIRMAGD